MDELRFVLKCFLFSALLISFSQIKTAEGTIESRIHGALVSSETAAFVNQAAAGAVKGVLELKEYLNQQIQNSKKAEKPVSSVVTQETSQPEDESIIEVE